jgi:hypothetical protein
MWKWWSAGIKQMKADEWLLRQKLREASESVPPCKLKASTQMETTNN